MSVELDIRNLKDPRDLQRKRAEFFKLLRLQAKLNDNYEQAINTMIENRTLEITPKAPIEQTTGEKLNNSIQQQQIAFSNLSTIMSPDDAKVVISRLYDGKSLLNINILNQQWKGISDGLKGAKDISPDYFINYFTRYKQKMNEEPFGISLKKEGRIGMTKDTEFYQEPIDSIDYRKYQLEEKLKEKEQKEQKEQQAKARTQYLEAFRKANLGIQATRALQRRFRKKKQEEEAEYLANLFEEPGEPEIPAEAKIEEGDFANYGFIKKKTIQLPAGKEFTELQKEYVKQQRNNLDSFDLLTLRKVAKYLEIPFAGLKKPKLIPLIKAELSSSVSAPTSPVANLTPGGFANPGGGADDDEDDEDEGMLPNPYKGPPKGKGFHSRIYGHAKILKKSHLRRIKTGNGIDSLMKEKYKTFGRYVIHIPSLKKGVLNIKYPSWASIANLPQQIIDDELREFILDLLEHKEMNKRYFQNLKDSNQKLFQKIAFQAQIDDQLGLGLPRTDEEKAELKRFELVRGEVIAGQNNPEVIKELKHFIIKFMGEGKLTKKQGYDILSELVVV